MKKIITAAAAVSALAGGAAYLASDALFKALISRDFRVPKVVSKFITQNEEKAEKPQENPHAKSRQKLEDYGYEMHSIISDRGQRLQGYLMKPEKASDIYVFASHGYRGSGKDEWCTFVDFYVKRLGINLFFVDHQSHGNSEGEYIGFASHEHKDCLKWLRYMNDTFGSDINIFLHGISMGSATVMLMTGSKELPENVKFTVADCGYTSAMDEFMYKINTLKLPFKPLIPIISAINHKRAGYDFQDDTNALAAVKKAKIPMIFIHGDKDMFVPTHMVYEVYEACGTEKELLIAEGAGHAESYAYATREYEQVVEKYIEKHI